MFKSLWFFLQHIFCKLYNGIAISFLIGLFILERSWNVPSSKSRKAAKR